MSGTKRTILFFSSFFLTILFMSIVGIILSPIINTISDYVYYNIFSPILFTIYLFIFMLIEGFLRKIYTNKYLKDNQLLIKVKAKEFELSGRLLVYLIILLIYFTPLLRDFSMDLLTIPRVLLFIFSIIISELLLRISSKSIYGYLTKDYVIISGLDLRIGLPIIYGSNIFNDSEVYTYNDIKEYFVFPETIELYLVADQGKLVFDTDNEVSRQFIGILTQKKIPMKKFN
ncbi:hypothetical protein GOQ27_03005 [Clostridium sp. D2Q-11]|uniref:Uncharacterized protein n=1 Tax=Anaeromonas frigoriresistens TaxID=2683708 RepID=A0A942Z7M8_9FIRM|nr:hypothetical protein [Anaeromonas frigoriresistens]MBS4537413.1 hypothetical protein [Anaeromonas frigoriresistens]